MQDINTQNNQASQIPEDLAKYVDLESALKRLRGNKKIYKTLLSSFLGDKSLQTLLDSIAEGNNEAAVMAAHSIKGMAGNLSLEMLYQNSIVLEQQLKNNQVGDIALLESIWNKTCDYIQYVFTGIDNGSL